MTRFANRTFPAPAAALLALTVLMAGCSWFKPKAEYEGVELTKPIAVPADLSKPKERDALRIPAKSLVGANAVSAEVVRSFPALRDVPGTWRRIGEVLPGIPGVEVLSQAESIASYEVRYGGEVFLISVQPNASVSRVVAVSADGGAAESAASGQLLALLKAKL